MSTPAARSAAPQVAPPMVYEWAGDGWKPVGRYAREADRYFAIGERRKLADHYDRSEASHRHEFAELREAFHNLPEALARQFPDQDSLRKFCLCKAGFYKAKRHVICPSKSLAVELYRLLSSDYDYAVIDGNAVTFFTAESQSYRATDRRRFQAQKDGILTVLAELLGVAPEALSANAGRAA